MATVTNLIRLPDGSAPLHATVTIELVAAATVSPVSAGWVTTTDATIMAVAEPLVVAGAWTADLIPNADIDPAGTVYRVIERVSAAAGVQRYEHYIEVDADGGTVHDLLTSGPSSLMFDSVTNHNANAGAHPGFYRAGGTDVAVADGGTGASTKAAARASLEVQRVHKLDIREFGAVSGNNVTSEINAALAAAAAGDTVYVPTGTWWVFAGNGSGVGGLQLSTSRVHLELADGAEIKVAPNNLASYHMLWVTAPDAVVSGGRWVGDVGAHTGVTGEWGHGIVLATGANRAIVRETEVTLCWGDGINITGTNLFDCRLSAVRCHDNRRNGCSVVEAQRVMIDWSEFTYNGTTGYTSPGAGIDWEPNATGTVTGQMSNCVTAHNAGPGVAVGGITAGSTTAVRIDGYRSFNDNQLGALGLGECGLLISSYSTAEVSAATIIGAKYGVLTAPTAKAKLTDVMSQGASFFGFNISGPVELSSCTARDPGRTGFYINPTADSPVLNGCVVEGAGAIAAGQGFDIYGDNAVLENCLVRLPGPFMAYSYVVRTGAAGATLNFCPSITPGTSGHYVDQTGTARAFPRPGSTFPPTITGSRGGNAALADYLTKMAGVGLLIDGTTA